MEDEQTTQGEEVPKRPGAKIVTVHGERATLWHVVDPNAPEAEQPAVIRTFSSVNATREDAERLVQAFP